MSPISAHRLPGPSTATTSCTAKRSTKQLVGLALGAALTASSMAAFAPQASAANTTSNTNISSTSTASQGASCQPGSLVFTPVYAINAGGPEVSIDGRTWAADTYGKGGHTWTTPSKADIANTDMDVLYRSERAGHRIGYTLPAANGVYRVRLHMAEIWWNTPYGSQVPGRKQRPGKRVESFNINGGLREVHNFDPAVATGGTMRAVTRTFTTVEFNRKITIYGTAKTDMAQLAAIEVDRVSLCRTGSTA